VVSRFHHDGCRGVSAVGGCTVGCEGSASLWAVDGLGAPVNRSVLRILSSCQVVPCAARTKHSTYIIFNDGRTVRPTRLSQAVLVPAVPRERAPGCDSPLLSCFQDPSERPQTWVQVIGVGGLLPCQRETPRARRSAVAAVRQRHRRRRATNTPCGYDIIDQAGPREGVVCLRPHCPNSTVRSGPVANRRGPPCCHPAITSRVTVL
jgi:hypothetical protein